MKSSEADFSYVRHLRPGRVFSKSVIEIGHYSIDLTSEADVTEEKAALLVL